MIFVTWRLRAALCALACWSGAASAQSEFPFDSELIMDVAPMRGSKRIPNMDVAANGAIALEMWCNRVEGQFVVAGDTVTVLTGQGTQRACAPESGRRATSNCWRRSPRSPIGGAAATRWS